MHSKKLLSLALSLFIAESVVASPCKPKTTTDATSVTSNTLSESTTTILPVSSTTETTLATIETSTAAETSETETETETTTTLLTSTTATSAVDTTTTEEGTTTVGETTTAVEAQTTTTAEAETTTEAATTTAAEPVCAQTLLLANPTPIFGSGNTVDDDSRSVVPPFSIEVYGVGSTDVYVGSNGFVTLSGGSSSFNNGPLPAQSLPSISIMPYWDDLIIRGGTCNTGIYYDVYETDRGNTFTVEWQLSSIGLGDAAGEHFSASFYEDFPGLVRFEYYQTARHGSSATVGLQNGQQYSQYSYNQDNSIPDQFFVEIDTSSGTALTLSGAL
ncbi:hypothetical protein FOC4_g10004347 [Fusarium odoratissimum]|uniref:PA14 domain-containing protein n=1 Tax=Fusarium oxysporum f. sp. cubense (strain race 4) TaxID=2502994 RepID=N1SB46_FUSC4|nr:hypothetical protein FOC4_g10004347 [Fusarium odoratissimum]